MDDIPRAKPGYIIHIGPDPDNSMIRAAAEGLVLDELPLPFAGQFQRMEPVDGIGMLPRFRELFEKHQEFLFAPVRRREDGRLWVELECGIIKRSIYFRNLNEIT